MKVKSNTSLLSELPDPPAGKTGWPWTINETSSLIRPASDKLEWPRVSIITPSYNQSQFLEKTIRSVLLQEYPNLEYWLMDGGSTDGSIEIIRKYERWLSGWVSEKDNGQSDAINKGLLRSTGNIFAWLNSDDCYLQGCIWTTVKEFSERPIAGMIYSNVEIIDENDRYLNLFPWRCYNFNDQLIQKMTIPQPAAFWRREVMDTVGLLRPDLHYAMDYEYWIRIGRNFEIIGLDKPMAQFRQTNTSKGGTQSSGWGPEYLKILDDIYGIRTIQPEILKLRSKAYAGAYYKGSTGYLTANNISNARHWIVKSAKYDPSLLLSFSWWYAMVKILSGRRLYTMLRSLKANMG